MNIFVKQIFFLFLVLKSEKKKKKREMIVLPAGNFSGYLFIFCLYYFSFGQNALDVMFKGVGGANEPLALKEAWQIL